MRILLVSSFLTFGETRLGGSRRIYNIARNLEEKHDLSVLCFDASEERPRWDGRPPFRKFLLLTPAGAGMPRRRWAHGLDKSRMVAALRATLSAFLSGERFDCVILAYALAPNLLRMPQVAGGGRIVYIEGDLVIGQADALRRRASGPFARLLKEIRYRQTLAYYRAFLPGIDTFFLSTRTEMREVERRFPGVRTVQLPIGLDLSGIRPLPAPGSGAIAGFLGNFGHAPNRDAVLWYLEQVHPALRALHFGYRFHLAGMDLPEEILAKAEGDASLVILGAVDDLEDFYRRISFFVNPIVSGKGIRTKVIEAAAFGRAIVSTRLGADGTEPLETFLGDAAEDFRACCSRLIRGEAGTEAMRTRNRRIVEVCFSNEAVERRLLERGSGEHLPGSA